MKLLKYSLYDGFIMRAHSDHVFYSLNFNNSASSPMIATTYNKIVVRQTVASVLFLAFLLIYDVVLDILLSGIFVLYELIEIASEELVEYLFRTNHHQTEIIVIYVFFFIGLYALYRFAQASPRLTRRTKRRITARWIKKKSRISRYWHTFSSFQKFKIVMFYSTGMGVLITWLFFL